LSSSCHLIPWAWLGIMTFALEALYTPTPKSEVELQVDVEAPVGKAGKEKGSALLLAADALRCRKDIEGSYWCVKEAIAIFREQGAEELEALALSLMAKIRVGGTFNLEALQAAKKASKLFKELGSTKGQAAAAYVVALVHEATPSPEDAAWQAGEARRLFQQAGDRVGEAVALETAARCYLLLQDFQKGLPAAQDALATFRELGEGQKEAATLCVLAKMHLGRSELEMALQMAKDAVAKYGDLGQTVGDALDIAMDVFMKMGSKDDAVFIAQQEIERLKQIGNTKEEGAVLYKIAQLHRKSGKPELAAAPAAEAAAAARSAFDRMGELEATVLGASIKLDLREKAEAERLAQAALDMAKDAGPSATDLVVDAIRCMSQVKAASKAFQGAFDTAIGAMNLFKGQGNAKGEASSLLVISELQVQIRDSDGALNTLQASIPLFVAAGAKKDEAAALIKLAQMHSTRGESRQALKAAEEALAIYRKLADNAGKADAALVAATAHFALSGRGNALEAMRAAQEAVSVYSKLGEKAAEANALNVLANSQLMNQSFAEAQKTARKAKAIFRDLDDADGQAGALLLVAGAHLGAGEFAESKDVAKDARTLFQDTGNGKGEDGADDFLDVLKQYESGGLSRTDFMGFTMSSGEPTEKGDSERKKAKERKRDTAVLANVDLFVVGPKGDKHTVTFFKSFETRRATAPTRGPAARRSGEAAMAAAGDDEVSKQVADPVTFAIRLMPNNVVGEEVPEKKPKYEPIEIEDKRVSMSVDLGQPSVKYPGNCGKTNRMFSAMGAQKL